jgi:hypothetical protein
MNITEIHNLLLSIQTQANNAIQEHRCDDYTIEEQQWNEQLWIGVKIGAETLYKKIQEKHLAD